MKDELEATCDAIDWDGVIASLDDAKGGRTTTFPEYLKVAQKVFSMLGEKRKLNELKNEFPSEDMLPDVVKAVIARLALVKGAGE